MNTPQDKGSALPGTNLHMAANGHIERVAVNFGMTMRDWFAGMALQGMLSNPDFNGCSDAAVAEFAFGLADAMVAACRKEDV